MRNFGMYIRKYKIRIFLIVWKILIFLCTRFWDSDNNMCRFIIWYIISLVIFFACLFYYLCICYVSAFNFLYFYFSRCQSPAYLLFFQIFTWRCMIKFFTLHFVHCISNFILYISNCIAQVNDFQFKKNGITMQWKCDNTSATQ